MPRGLPVEQSARVQDGIGPDAAERLQVAEADADLMVSDLLDQASDGRVRVDALPHAAEERRLLVRHDPGVRV